MSDYAEQTWAWIHDPLQRLRESCRTEPAEPWEQRLTVFLGELGLSSADDHPVVRSMVDEVDRQADTDEARAAIVADDSFDGLVYGWIAASDTSTEAGAEGTAGGVGAVGTEAPQEAPGDPSEVSEQAVLLIGLPALRGVAADHPELLAGLDVETVTAPVATVLAYRLTGQAAPQQDTLSPALLARVEELLGTQEAVVARFWALFGTGPIETAEQWVTHHLTQQAGEIAPLLPAPQVAALDHDAVVAAVLKEVPDAEEVLTPEEIQQIIAEELGASATDRPMGS